MISSHLIHILTRFTLLILTKYLKFLISNFLLGSSPLILLLSYFSFLTSHSLASDGDDPTARRQQDPELRIGWSRAGGYLTARQEQDRHH